MDFISFKDACEQLTEGNKAIIYDNANTFFTKHKEEIIEKFNSNVKILLTTKTPIILCGPYNISEKVMDELLILTNEKLQEKKWNTSYYKLSFENDGFLVGDIYSVKFVIQQQ